MAAKAVIVANGSADLSKVDFSQYKFILGCDGGTKYLSDAGVVPHAIMGDFDSINQTVRMEMFMLGVAQRTFPSEKDFSDLKAASDFISELGYDEIDIYGGCGTRLDHSLSNMMILFDLYKKGVKARLIDEKNIVFPLMADVEPVEFTIPRMETGTFVSFVAIGLCTNVKIEGLKYELNGVDIDFDNITVTVSNEPGEGEGKILFDSGRMLVFYSRD